MAAAMEPRVENHSKPAHKNGRAGDDENFGAESVNNGSKDAGSPRYYHDER